MLHLPASAVPSSPRLVPPTTHQRQLQTLVLPLPMVTGRRRALLVWVGSSAAARQAAPTPTQPAAPDTDAGALSQVLLPELDPRLRGMAGV